MSNHPSEVPQPSLAALGAPPPYSSTVDFAQNRPSLPEAHRNPFLQALPEDAHLVKFQTIVRENRNIIVGRVKVPIPGQSRHAFILRRYDTDAISMTTMFKVAFPGASEAAEKREEEFVVSNYDTRGTNGGRNNNHVRLAGTWVSKQLAEYLAPAYGVASLVNALARAVPDPRVEYRMSQRSVQAQEAFARTRAAATAPAAAQSQTTATGATNAAAAAPAQGGSTPKRQRAAAPIQAPDTDTTVSAPAQASTSAAAPGGDQRTYTLEAVTTITVPVGTEAHMDAEIAASKQLVLDLKKEMRLRSAAGRSLADDDSAPVAESSAAGASRAAKRSADDDEATVIPAGLGRPSEARVIRRNRRIEVQGPGATRQQTVKKVAWSAVVFGIGFAASTLLPSFAALNL